MQVKRFENEKAVVEVYYNTLPTEKDLADDCALFMRKAIRERKEKEKQENEEKRKA